jgi:hypothetical protein
MRQGVPQDGTKLWHDSQLWKPKEKAKSATTKVDKLPKGRPAELEMKKTRVEASGEDKTTREEEKATGA